MSISRSSLQTLTVIVCLSMALPAALQAGAADRAAGFQPDTLAVTGARLVTSPGVIIESGNLIIRDGRIIALGPDAEVPPGAARIDADGLTVYPGFIDAASSKLLDDDVNRESGRDVEFGRYVLAATRPDNRSSLTPEFQAADHLRRSEADRETWRRAGFTAVHLLPTGRVASGQGALISTGDNPPREALIVPATMSAFELFGPSPSPRAYPTTLMGAQAYLRQAFLDAVRHAEHWRRFNEQAAGLPRPPADLSFAALNEVREGGQRAVFYATTRDDVERALNFADEHELRVLLWGGHEAHRALERLNRDQVDLLLQVDFGDEPKIEPRKPAKELQAEIKDPLRVQQFRHSEWQARVAAPAALRKAGLRCALSSRGFDDPGDLLASVRQAVEHGWEREAALAALTVDAAAILGVDDRLGTLAPGKLAHVVVTTGPFDHPDTKVRWTIVDAHKYEYNEDAEPVTPADDEGESAPDVDLSGRWEIEIEADERQTATLELKQTAGGKLSGGFESPQAEGRVSSGKLQGRKLEFVVAIGAGDRTVELKFSGKARKQKQRISGTLKSAFGAPADWTANRVSEPEAEQPDESEDKTATDKADEPPTELPEDRRARPIQTNGNVLVKGGTVLTGTGDTLPQTSILVRDGKIAAIGPDLKAEEGMTVLDVSGRYVMPGIVDTHSHIMISEGTNESTQSIVAEVRIKDCIDTDDPAEYRALAGGVTAARLLHGSANVIGGQDAVVKMKVGATAREHLVPSAPQGIKFALGENVKARTSRFPNTRMGVEATLNRAFFEAIDYRRQWREYERALEEAGDGPTPLPPRRDLRLEALADVVDHKMFIHSHCYRADEILMLLRVASGLGIRVWSLQHVLEGYKVAPEIAAHGASCSTFADWWAYKVEAYDATPYNAALLHEAGANVVIKSDNAELMRHLYAEAAKPVRYGNLPVDAALQTITLNAARELGLDDRMGSIEVGKDADLAIFSGHPFNSFSRCEQTLIDGEVYFTRERQPTAMSEAAVRRSSNPGKWSPPKKALRERRIDFPDSGEFAIVGATIHPVVGKPVPRGTVLISDGKIAAVGKRIPLGPEVPVVDASRLHVFPGLIDSGTTLGLVEIGKVRETHDYAESGRLQPDLKAGVAINPDSELFPVARAGGVTVALLRPTGGLICGQASLAESAGWTVPEMVLEMRAGLQINWPRGRNAESQVEELKDFLEQARLYLQLRSAAEEGDAEPPLRDPRFESLAPYLAGERPVLIEADARQQIAEALLFAEEEELEIIITGGGDAWKLAGELKRRDVPVIVGPVMRRPVSEFDPFDAPYANPGRLHEEGVTFCIRSDSASNSRNVAFEAAMAVAYGLPAKAALKAVTLDAAKILGVADRLGSIEEGKRANLIITDGSPLQITTQIKGTIIEGRGYAPESRQTRFYEKYRRRLHEVRAERAALPQAGS